MGRVCGPRKVCTQDECCDESQGLILKESPPRCDAAACSEDECCDQLDKCGDCAAGFVAKASLPTYCAGCTCEQSECCGQRDKCEEADCSTGFVFKGGRRRPARTPTRCS